MKLIVKFAVCLLILALSIYVYIDSSNHLISIRLKIPEIEKKLMEVKAENMRLQYEIDQFESPSHLMELARKPEFGYLKMPYLPEIIQLESHER